DALDPRNRVARAKQLSEVRLEGGCEVASPGVDVLSEQGDLLDPVLREQVHLGDDLPRPATLLSPPDCGNDAVGAPGVAAHGDLDPRLNPALAAHRQVGGEVLVRSELPSRKRVATGLDPLAEMRDRARPERDVDERVVLEDSLPLCLCVAPADRDDEIRPLPLAGGGVPEVRS